MNKGVCSILLLFAIGLSSCSSSSTLSRGKAKSLLESSKEFTAPQAAVRLTDAELKLGVQSGYWTVVNGVFGSGYNLTPKGRQLFTDWMPYPARIIGVRGKMSRYVVEITGITDAPMPGTNGQVKLVKFTWNWRFTDLSPEAQAFFSNYAPRPYNAVLRLYDDGWRVEGFVLDDGETDTYWQ